MPITGPPGSGQSQVGGLKGKLSGAPLPIRSAIANPSIIQEGGVVTTPGTARGVLKAARSGGGGSPGPGGGGRSFGFGGGGSLGGDLTSAEQQLATDLANGWNAWKAQLPTLQTSANWLRDAFFGLLGSTNGWGYSPYVTVNLDVILAPPAGAQLPPNVSIGVTVLDANGNTVASSSQSGGIPYTPGGLSLQLTGLFNVNGTYTVTVQLDSPFVLFLGRATVGGAVLIQTGATVTIPTPAFYTSAQLVVSVTDVNGRALAGYTVAAQIQDASSATLEAQPTATTDGSGVATLSAAGLVMVSGEILEVTLSAFAPGSTTQAGGVVVDVTADQLQGAGAAIKLPTGTAGSQVAGVGPSVIVRWKLADGTFVTGFTATVQVNDANGSQVDQASASDGGSGWAVVRFATSSPIKNDPTVTYTLIVSATPGANVSPSTATASQQTFPNVGGQGLVAGISAMIGGTVG